MEPVEIVRTDGSPAQLEQAFLIRRRVFIDEQGVSEELEFDALDDGAIHLLASLGDQPLGTLRVRFPTPTEAKIERVAVLRAARGHKVGQRLILAAIDLARNAGARDARLHAQVQARGFYERLGFRAFGDTFVEDGILHVAMRRRLASDQEDDAA